MRNPLRGLIQKSFLERNQKLIGLIAIVLLFGGSAFALLLQGGVFQSSYHVKAYFTDAAGIVPGDVVTVAGLKAGTVKSMEIENGRVAMDLAIDQGIELPKDTRANIKIQTLLGREAVDLVAGGERAMLADGDTIPVSRTTTPIDITDLNDISVRLLNRSDAGALNQMLKEISDITSGKATQVRTLVDGLGKVVTAVDERRDQLSHLIDSLKAVSTTLANKDDTIVSLIDNLNPVLSNLAAREDAIKRLLEASDSASHETADLITRNRGTLDRTLRALHTDLQVLDHHQVDLAATIQYLNSSVRGYQSVGYSNGVPNRWANIFVQSLGPLGIDAVLGQCGVIDHLIDEVLGENCKDRGKGGPPIPLPTPTVSLPPLPTPTVSLPTPLPTPSLSLPTLPSLTPPVGKGPLPSLSLPAPDLPRDVPGGLPGNVGDLVDDALAGTGGS
jgi:phospholipid/cholesterol/gamma-HCH transport system substrate-binding protein